MTTKNTMVFITGTIIVIAAVFYVSTRIYSFNRNKIEKISIGKNIFYAEVVSSSDKMQKGLGGRDDLCQSCAMLFRFASPGRYAFWMKDMRFPLDIIWISDGKVVYLEKNVSENFSGVMIPTAAADQVLEINSGISDKLGIKVGDLVK